MVLWVLAWFQARFPACFFLAAALTTKFVSGCSALSLFDLLCCDSTKCHCNASILFMDCVLKPLLCQTVQNKFNGSYLRCLLCSEAEIEVFIDSWLMQWYMKVFLLGKKQCIKQWQMKHNIKINMRLSRTSKSQHATICGSQKKQMHLVCRFWDSQPGQTQVILMQQQFLLKKGHS